MEKKKKKQNALMRNIIEIEIDCFNLIAAKGGKGHQAPIDSWFDL